MTPDILKLKIKCMSLAAEGRIIRTQTRRQRNKNRRFAARKGVEITPEYSGIVQSLNNHRLLVVRTEARDSYIAYGFLRGKAYHEIEICEDHNFYTKGVPRPNWDNVTRIINKFGDKKFEVKQIITWADSSAAERRSHKAKVASSILARPTISFPRDCVIRARDQRSIPGFVIQAASTVYIGDRLIKSREVAVKVS